MKFLKGNQWQIEVIFKRQELTSDPGLTVARLIDNCLLVVKHRVKSKDIHATRVQ